MTGYLRPANRRGVVDLWIDRLMPGGDLDREIEQKLSETGRASRWPFLRAVPQSGLTRTTDNRGED